MPLIHVRIHAYYDSDFFSGESFIDSMFNPVKDFYMLASKYKLNSNYIPDELISLPTELIDYISNHERRTYQRFNRELQLDSELDKENRVHIAEVLELYHFGAEKRFKESREMYKVLVGE